VRTESDLTPHRSTPPPSASPRRRIKRQVALATAAVIGIIPAIIATTSAPHADAATTASAFSATQWTNPGMQYRPGVRWWWPGGAVDDTVIDQQLNYLSSHGFGYVEINPFGATPVPGDEAKVMDIYTPTFYEHLEHAIATADKLGITVDLNMGSGWNANGPSVTAADGMGNMGLGQSTVSGATLKQGSISIPALAKSQQYTATSTFPAMAKLEGVLVAKKTGNGPTITGNAALFNDGTTNWGQTVTVDPSASYMIDASSLGSSPSSFNLPDDVASKIDDSADYDVVALYELPAGSAGVSTARPDWLVVDHMDATKTLNYLNQWLGEPTLNAIIHKYSNVRAVFNDSLELSTDTYFDDSLYKLAKDSADNGLGYDFSKYLPMVYEQNLKAAAYRPNQMGGSTTPYVAGTSDPSVQSRILADFQTLVGQGFMQGFKGFQKGAHENGLLYRQQAYNPPLDQIGAAKYIDIPEEEQGNESNLRTAASGGHLYGRNLVTAEQFTLGLNPLTDTLDDLKAGYDLMATSGVNNFIYHGLPYPYGVGTTMYGEQGWSAFPTIGVDPSSNNTLSKYFPEMNQYASRLNYLGQTGAPSEDVAVYTPFNGKAATTGATPVLNSNGYAWDAINDASITDGSTAYTDGKISVNGGQMKYDAIVVQSANVPVATMKALHTLAEQGAPIIFYNTLPTGQSGFDNGNYAADDAQVASLAQQTLLDGNESFYPTSSTALVNDLKKVSSPEITYEANDNVRFIRRDMSDGGTLVYLRNTGTTTNTVTLDASSKYANYYWLDQETGKIFPATVTNGQVTFTLDAGQDSYGGLRVTASLSSRSRRGSHSRRPI
jgi:hypothetical protein